MKRFLLILLFIVLPVTASAHVLRIDSGIGVTVHIEPDDEPATNQTSLIYIEITDSKKQFVPSDCRCILTIQRDNTILAEIPATSQEGYTHIGFGFPEAGTYKLTVSGISLTGHFSSFSTDFDYYVRANGSQIDNAETNNPLQAYVPYIIFAVGLLIIMMFLGPPLWTQKGRE